MSDQQPQDPTVQPFQTAPEKPAYAVGVKPPIMLPNAVKPSGPGLSPAAAPFSAGVKPSLGGPRPRLRAIEPAHGSAAASYKVQVSAPTEAAPAFPILHLVMSGMAAAIAITAAILLYLKF